VWQKENQDINGFFKLTRNASIEKVLAATLDDGFETTGKDKEKTDKKFLGKIYYSRQSKSIITW
jgi:hypothetical protein